MQEQTRAVMYVDHGLGVT